MSPDHLRPHELDGLRRAGIVPIPFESSEPFIPASVRNQEQFVLCAQGSAAMHRPAAVCVAEDAFVRTVGNHEATLASYFALLKPQGLGPPMVGVAFGSALTPGRA